MFELSFDPTQSSRSPLEKGTLKGDSPVGKRLRGLVVFRVLSIGYLARMWEASTSNPKYVLSPIANSTVRER